MTLFPLLLAAALSAGNQEFDQTAIRGTIAIVSRRLEKKLFAEGPTKGGLKSKMLADPSKYDTLAKAKQESERDYIQLLNSEYVDGIIDAANRTGFLMMMDSCWPNGDQRYKPVFERRFAEERRAACEEQAKTIAAKVKPAEADFGRKDEAVIRSELAAAVIAQQQTVVFEENRAYVSEQIVEPVMESAKKEIARQRESLKRLRGEAFAPSVLERELTAKLEKSVNDRNAKRADEAIVWGVFPIVCEEGVKEVVKKRTLERVADAVDGVEVSVDAASIRGEIAADPVRHRKASDSEQAFRGVFADFVASNAVEVVVAEAPEGERAEFREYVTARSGEASLGRAVEARVRRELLPRLREVRGEIAAEDAKRFWPTLMDGTWFPEPSLADEVCSRSDYSKTVRCWRDSPELVSFAQAAGGSVVLEETEALADGRVAKAFDLARSAINAQNAVLDRVVPTVTDEAKSRRDSWFSRTPDFRKLVELLTGEVVAKWDETRLDVLWGEDEKPANAEEQHRELFPSVKKRIELVAKTILEEIERPEPEERPEPTEPEEGETPETSEYTVSVRKTGDRLETKILRGGDALFERSCPAAKDEFRSVTGALTDKLIEILELK